MKHFIIEDSSPFYVKFKHQGLEDIIVICQHELEKISQTNTFAHHALPVDVAEKILDHLPLSKLIDFQKNRVSLFISAPGHRHEIHIDQAPVSINYGVSILDNLCQTNWYADHDIVDNFPVAADHVSRAFIHKSDFDKNRQLPVKSFIMAQGEAVVFNSNDYHDFDNGRSRHYRCVLTLRLANKNIKFDFLKKIMFENLL